MTAAAHSDSDVADLLQSLEEYLFQPATRKSPAAVAALLADDFCEFGASGQTYTRQQTIDRLAEEGPTTISLSDFACQLVSTTIALVTYRSYRAGTDTSPAVTALRSSLWIHRDRRWQMLFHQGTRT